MRCRLYNLGAQRQTQNTRPTLLKQHSLKDHFSPYPKYPPTTPTPSKPSSTIGNNNYLKPGLGAILQMNEPLVISHAQGWWLSEDIVVSPSVSMSMGPCNRLCRCPLKSRRGWWWWVGRTWEV